MTIQQAMGKADTLIEALQWIRQFRGKFTVIKLGGSLMENEIAMLHLLVDAIFMETVGMRPVIVHGGGNAISKAMSDAGIQPKFVQGRRYTDEAALEIVKKVLAHDICTTLVRQISEIGGAAKPLSLMTGTNVLYGKKLSLNDTAGHPIDLGCVGEVVHVDTSPILEACLNGLIPVIPSMAVTEDGRVLNVNADTAATAVARQLKAAKLVFVTDVNGVRTDPNNPDSMIESVTLQKANELLASGAICGGMIPKIQSCLETLANGVEKIHIINGQLRHSLLLEIFTTQGVGTEITSV
ncbi:MAG: acetylglutamate kinase [Planctomycetaceae bacterium]|jgi:acetylglutamate kinase|nr:acetylglutamate kinase [Planctomycetaceae bacterium]